MIDEFPQTKRTKAGGLNVGLEKAVGQVFFLG
jgi:hypothetical protein